MAVELTQGAIERMCNGDTEIKPYLQVTEIRLVNTSNQNSANERYRMLVSDGIHTQQGMLATQRNDLVKSGKLQKGSIVQLLQFVCNLIQGRKIIIIIELDVIQEKCDTIGQPASYMVPGGARPAQLQSPPDQTSTTFVNPQYGNAQSSAGSSVLNPNSTGGPPMQAPNLQRGPEAQSYGSSYANNSDRGRFAPTHSPTQPIRPGFGSGNSAASTNTGGFNNHRTEIPHGPTNAPTNARPVHQQPPPMYMNRGPIARNEAPARIIPVAALNPYQGRWTVKARVTAKSALRPYSNARGEGKVFSFDLLDSDGGEIRATCFNDVADQFYNQIEVGQVYMISKGQLRPAQKKYNHLPNDYEIVLDVKSVVQPCSDDDNSIPRQQFHFRPISDVEGMENYSIVDLIGIVSSITPTATIMKKDSTETQKRTLQLKDMSGKSVELTLWAELCNTVGQELQSMCDSGQFPVLAVKSGRVNDFNGKSVGTLSTSQLLIEPDFPEARALKVWFDREGRDTPCLSISREGLSSRIEVRKDISQIKDEKLGTSEKPDYITVCAHITFIKVDNFCYTACPIMIGDRKCAKKVINNGDGKWQCDRCDQVVDECEYRYILQCQIQDHTGLTWVTAFQECGEEIMGVPAKELHSLKFTGDDEKFNEIISSVLFTKFIFKLKVKEETYSDEQRIKSSIIRSDRVNFSSETRYLLGLMTKPTTEGSSTPFSVGNSYPTGQQPTAPTVSYGGNTGFSARETGGSANQATGTYGAPYGGSRYTTGNISGGVYGSCNSCGGTGHNTANCPSVMSGPGHSTGGGYVSRAPAVPAQGGSGGEECYKCHQTGHWARDCPGSNGVSHSLPSTGGASGECYKCHQTGHWARDCPGSSVGNQSGGGSGGGGGGGGECFKCHQFGHWARDCPGISSVPPAYGMQRQQFGGH